MNVSALPNHPAASEAPRTLPLALGALGVVFGDIGTSPLYAFKECLHGPHGAAVTHDNVLGVLSLIFWSITMVVSVKYLTFIMRADNHGEGGILALLALLPRPPSGRSHAGWFAVLGVTGAALLYGDGIVTPAISVLSALEGLGVQAPGLRPLVIPLTCLTLLGLFAVQRRGTGDIGKLFGPVMVLWFLTIGALGAFQVLQNPGVFAALSPLPALRYFQHNGPRGVLVLGAVVLSVTGGEALYADMGHFGVRPIRLAWFALVLPALLLAYFGQGALVLRDPGALDNPFFGMVGSGVASYALVGLASLATVIASQSLISGAFSLTRQAIQLGYLPRLRILHTAREAEGQVYVPAVNWALALACVALVLIFRVSSGLAAAYGIAVSGTMAITSVLFFEVVRVRWKWPLWLALALLFVFLSFDLPFLFANSLKILQGGYVPVLVAVVLVTVMLIWKWGQTLLVAQLVQRAPRLDDFVQKDAERLLLRPRGTAVFVCRDAEHVPPALQRQVDAIPALHETVVVLSVVIERVPDVPESERLTIESLGQGFFRVRARYGFVQDPDVSALVRKIAAQGGAPIDLDNLTYYLRRETFVASSHGKMGTLGEHVFRFLSRNAHPVDAYFNIPHDRVFEVGAQLDL